MQQMDAVTREIGDRGKPKAALLEAVPPPKAPAPAPAPAPTPTAPGPATAPATPSRAVFSPSFQASPQPQQHQQQLAASVTRGENSFNQGSSGSGLSLREVSTFMDGLLDKQRDRDDEQREREDRLTKVLMAQLTPQPAISAEQLEALQARLEGLHADQLVSEEELHALQDLIADYIELRTSTAAVLTREVVGLGGGGFAAAAKLAQLVGLSEGMPAGGAFARQARRKFV